MNLKEKIEILKLNLTEEEVIGAIKRVSSLFARDLTFSIYAEEDILQESFIIAFNRIHKFKLSKGSVRGTKTHLDQLERFFYVTILNRIKNLKRDKFCRNDPPCLDCYKGNTCGIAGAFCEKYKEWKERNDIRMSIHNPWSLSPKDESRPNDPEDLKADDIPCPNSEKLFDGIDVKDAIHLIKLKLSKEYLELFNALYSGQKIGYAKKAALLEQIHDILGTA